MKNNWIIVFFLLLSLSASGQIIEHEFRCRTKTYVIELPEDFEKDHFHYTEGDYFTYYRFDTITRKDTARLTLHCGSMVKLPHLEGSNFSVEKSTKFQRSGTQLGGRFWRELNLSGDMNIFYQDATDSERKLFDEAIWNMLNRTKKPSLTNTTEFDEHNIYLFSVNVLLDSLSVKNPGIFVIEGDPAYKVHSRYLNHTVLNSKRTRMFNHKSHLLKEFKHLVGKDLIRLRLRSIYIENSRVKVPIFISKTVYATGKRSHTELIMDGLWNFAYKFNSTTDAFELESIGKGIEL